jgi:beta-glucosidase
MQIDHIRGSQQNPDNLEVTVHVKIRNTGRFDGAEVAQLYLTFPKVAQEPPKILRGFEKIYLTIGEEKEVTFTLKKKELSYYDTKYHEWTVPKGEFIVHVGSSSKDIRGTSSFTL